MRISRAAILLGFALAALAWAHARAGTLSRADLERAFPAPFILGEKDDALPVWPIFKQNATENELVAYVYESIDLAPIPGFSGTPIDLLVALEPDGTFLDVKVVSFHEPVFVDGLGPEPLFDFVKQYAGKSLKQTIKVGPPGGGLPSDGAVAVIDGVAKATASVRILNETLLASGLKVAREKLGFAQGRDPTRVARIRPRRLFADDLRRAGREGLPEALPRLQRRVRGRLRGHGGGGARPRGARAARRRVHRPLRRRTRRADGWTQPDRRQGLRAARLRPRRPPRARRAFDRPLRFHRRRLRAGRGADAVDARPVRRPGGNPRLRVAQAADR